jgi:hypothetical protein
MQSIAISAFPSGDEFRLSIRSSSDRLRWISRIIQRMYAFKFSLEESLQHLHSRMYSTFRSSSIRITVENRATGGSQKIIWFHVSEKRCIAYRDNALSMLDVFSCLVRLCLPPHETSSYYYSDLWC